MREFRGPLVVAQISCWCVLILSVLCPSAVPQSTKVTDESIVLQLAIQTNKKTYIQGDLIPIHVQLTNVSRRNVIVGRDMWTNASPSNVQLSVRAVDGHTFGGFGGAVDGPQSFDDLPKAVLQWCVSLPPQYSYGSETSVQNFAQESGLIPGLYKVRASFESRGIDANIYFNPLLGNVKELEGLRAQDWKGVIGSNELTIRIVARR